MNVLHIKWVRAEAYCNVSGVSLFAIQELIRNGEIAATVHYKRTGQRTLWINPEKMDEWVDRKPHVEANCPLASKSGKAKTARACG